MSCEGDKEMMQKRNKGYIADWCEDIIDFDDERLQQFLSKYAVKGDITRNSDTCWAKIIYFLDNVNKWWSCSKTDTFQDYWFTDFSMFHLLAFFIQYVNKYIQSIILRTRFQSISHTTWPLQLGNIVCEVSSMWLATEKRVDLIHTKIPWMDEGPYDDSSWAYHVQ